MVSSTEMRWWGTLKHFWLSMEGQCVKSLLAGNDTQCFTTAQFEEAREAWLRKHCGPRPSDLPRDGSCVEQCRKQLRAWEPIVHEVSPDVWILNPEESL